MSKNLSVVPFQFESLQIRTVTDAEGNPMFIASDVASALGYQNVSEAISRHCRGVVKRYPIIDSLGRAQRARAIYEPDLYRLIVSSKLESAQRFERWVFDEVLPSLRKTGGYVMQSVAGKYKEACVVVRSVLSISKMLGTAPPMAKAIAVEDARRATGIDCSHLPPHSTVEEVPVGVRKLAEISGIPERKLSSLLMEKELATKDEGGNVMLTDKAKQLKAGSMEPFKSRFSNHSGYQCKWFPSIVIPLVKEAN